MRALSIKQPWADFILQGRKSIETRLWRAIPRIEYPETIAIHTGRETDVNAIHWFATKGRDIPYLHIPGSFPVGALLGLVTIVGCTVYSCHAQFEKDFDAHLSQTPIPPEDYNFVGASKVLGLQLKNPRRLIEPIRWKGALGFFDIGYINWMDDPCAFSA